MDFVSIVMLMFGAISTTNHTYNFMILRSVNLYVVVVLKFKINEDLSE